MGISTMFIDGLEGAVIDWDDVPDELYDKTQQFIRYRKLAWKLDDHLLYPVSGRYTPEAVINDLKKIVMFLDKHKIPWSGRKVAFSVDNDVGFIIVKEDTAILCYVKDDTSLDTEYIPLSNTLKLN